MFLKAVRLMIGVLFFTNHAFASDVNPVGTVKQVIELTHQAPLLPTQKNLKEIILSEYEVSDTDRKTMVQRIQKALTDNIQYYSSATAGLTAKAKKVQLGMNDVPVLDQGVHGTCATFATTAALDAVIGKGDYISQLCLLQLGNYIKQEGLGHSGWDGLLNKNALDRVNQYGIVSLKNQQKYGCAGVKIYPWYWVAPSSSMYPEAYLEYSEKIVGTEVEWHNLFDRMPANVPSKASDAAKAALDAGNRITFGVLLPRADLGTVGAMGWHHYFKDTWVLTHEVAEALEYATIFPGHAMVITGYDDAAVAMDHSGHRHHGLFTLRNSWGAYVADWGDFYMSYDYFDVLAMEGYEIQALAKH